MDNQIELVAYDDFWLKVYAKESATLEKLLRSNFIGCEHIGSTAIPSVTARPTLDILCVVHTLDGIKAFKDEFKKLGFILNEKVDTKDEFSFERFGPDGIRPLTNVRIYKKGDIRINDCLDFRDYLNAEDVVAREYQNTKASLVANYPKNSVVYEEAKTKFFEAVLSKIS